jgi:hypothetical protein
MTTNPFTFGNPIRDPARFYGRKEEIRQILNRLRSSAHESTSIVGERRIGKTSLLKFIDTPEIATELGLLPEEYCMIYIDFQGLTDITPHRFWERVLRLMERSICMPDLVPQIKEIRELEDFDLFDLEDLFKVITASGMTIVLLLDEFEYVTLNPNFQSDFFGGLRAIATHQNLSLITATRRELVDLCHSEELKGSPFFNIFANVVLRPFSREEVGVMLDGYLSESDISLSDVEKKVIMELGGGYPFFVQIAGNYMVEAKEKGLDSEEAVEEMVTQFDDQADAHFTYMWSHSSESEKINLLAVIALGQQKPSKKTLPTVENLAKVHSRAHLDIPELTKRGLLLEDQETSAYRMFSVSLERWIIREIAAVQGEEESEESVQTWLASGGREELVPVSGVLPKFKKKYWPVVSSVVKELTLEIATTATSEIVKQMFV